MEQDNFTVLENKTIGRNISLYRKIRGLKALDVAERLAMKEATYTRYERGETAITVDMLQQLAEILKVDPLTLLATHPSTFIENNGNNSPNAVVSLQSSNWHNANEQQTQLLSKLVENITLLNEKVIGLLEKR
jgi:transcriptional regulator with XRE-family HTH domain